MKVFINLINQPFSCRFTSSTQIWYGYNGFLERNMALFVNGGIWHADPRICEPTDLLFFKFKTSNKERKTVTAKDLWIKDRIHNNYLKSKWYIVIRFWEKEIECEIDRCIKIVKKSIQVYKKKKFTYLFYNLSCKHPPQYHC